MKNTIALLLLILFLCTWALAYGAVRTITEPSAADQQRQIYSRMRGVNITSLETDRKYAVVLLHLAPGVTQPADDPQNNDYAALKAGLEELTGIDSAELLVDGHAPASIPAGDQLRLIAEVYLNLNTPPPSP